MFDLLSSFRDRWSARPAVFSNSSITNPLRLQQIEDEMFRWWELQTWMKRELDGPLSVKFLEVSQLLQKLHAEQRKVLLFSGSELLLDELVHFLSERGLLSALGCHRLSSKPTQMAEGLNEFRRDSQQRILLMPLRKASEGVNLIVVDTIVLLEPSVSQAAIHQAIGRIQRLGQLNEELAVYYLLARGTVEESLHFGLPSAIWREEKRRLSQPVTLGPSGWYNNRKRAGQSLSLEPDSDTDDDTAVLEEQQEVERSRRWGTAGLEQPEDGESTSITTSMAGATTEVQHSVKHGQDGELEQQSIDSQYLRHRLPGLFQLLHDGDQCKVIDFVRNDLPPLLYPLLPLLFHGIAGVVMLKRAGASEAAENALVLDEDALPGHQQVLKQRLREQGMDSRLTGDVLDCLFDIKQEDEAARLPQLELREVARDKRAYRRELHRLLEEHELQEQVHLTTATGEGLKSTQSDHVFLLLAAERHERSIHVISAHGFTLVVSPITPEKKVTAAERPPYLIGHLHDLTYTTLQLLRG